MIGRLGLLIALVVLAAACGCGHISQPDARTEAFEQCLRERSAFLCGMP